MAKCNCGHNKNRHTKTIVENGYAKSLGCLDCSCEHYTRKPKRCNEYFRPEPNPEMLDGRCEREKGHTGEHKAIIMYQM